MSGVREPDACNVKWCDEVAGHEGPHRQPLWDSLTMDVETGRSVITQVWLQGESARVRALVLVTDARETGLTWQQAAKLAGTLASAGRRWSPS